MRIAFVVSGFPKLSETFILSQITSLLDAGHDVVVYANSKMGEGKVHSDYVKYGLSGRTVYYMPLDFWGGLLLSASALFGVFIKGPVAVYKSMRFCWRNRSMKPLFLFAAFSREKFDIIHCQFGVNGILGAHLKELGCGGKLVTSFHGYDVSSFILANGRGVYADLFRFGDLFLPVCIEWKRVLMSLGCDGRKIQILRMGVDLERFKLVRREAKPGGLMVIITVGRLVEKKGQEYSLRAFAKVAKEHDNIVYYIAGDGPLRGRLESLVSDLGLAGKVRFLGLVTQGEVLDLYRMADILVLSSCTAEDGDMDACPVVVTEAYSTGLPVVSTYHGGIPEIVIDGVNGFLVEERDVDALAEKMSILVNNRRLGEEMGLVGRQFVEKKLDNRVLNKKLEILYKRLLENG